MPWPKGKPQPGWMIEKSKAARAASMAKRRKAPVSVGGIEFWVCGCCKAPKPADEYYADKRTANGLKAQCKKCHLETAVRTRDKERHRDYRRDSARRARASDPEKFRRRHLEASRKRPPAGKRREARKLLNYAVRSGKVERPPKCQECDSRGLIHGHHEDYDRPLDVLWLCPECHGIAHRRINDRASAEEVS